MGLGDLLGKTLVKSTVLTEYQADTKQMRFELSRMSKEEQKRHRALIKQTEEQNYAIDKANRAAIEGDNARRASLAKVGVAVGVTVAATVAAYKLLQKGSEVYAKNSQLHLATVGVDLEGLRKATNGLVDDTRLLQFAASGMNGTFKLTQGQMEDSLRGVIALRNEGNELETTLNNVEKSLQQGTTRALKELGRNLDGVKQNSIEAVNASLKELRDTADKAGPDLSRPGDEMARAATDMENAVDALMHSLGSLAESLSPVLAKMAELVGLIVSAASEAANFVGDGSSKLYRGAKTGANAFFYAPDHIANAIDEYRNGPKGKLLNFPDQMGSGSSPTRGAEYEFRFDRSTIADTRPKPDDILGPYFDPHIQGRTKGSGGEFNIGGMQLDDGIGGIGVRVNEDGTISQSGGMAAGYTGLNSQGQRQIANDNARAMQGVHDRKGEMEGVNEAIAIALENAERFAQMEQDRQAGIFANLFGTPSEIDAQAMALQQLANTFDGFAGAFGAGVDALITGSSSFADAFKNAIGESLRAMAVEMSISALKHTAYGLASLAFMDGRGAAAHFAAAGTFTAGALAAGGGARLLGAGQAQGTGAPRTAGTAGVGTSGGASNDNGGGGRTQVFIVGNDHAGMPARLRESMWRETSRKAGVTIDGDAVING